MELPVNAWSRQCGGNGSPIASRLTTSSSLARDLPRFSINLTLLLKRVVALTLYFMRRESLRAFQGRCKQVLWGHWRLRLLPEWLQATVHASWRARA